MKEIRICKNEANQRLDKFLRKFMPNAPLSFIYKMLRKKNIKVNQKKSTNTYVLELGDTVQIYLNDETLKGFQDKKEVIEVKRSFSIVYEDENILLVNKPYGLIMHGDKKEGKNTLINQVIKYLNDKGDYDPEQEKTFVPASVNRLDRNTSGIVIIGKNHPTVQKLNELLRQNVGVQKMYLALVMGKITEEKVLKGFLKKDEFNNKVMILGKEEDNSKYIHTIIRPLKLFSRYSLVEVEIITGRSHQIRLHLASIGNPILGDPKYGNTMENQKMKAKFDLQRQFLHAYKLTFNNTLDHLEYLSNKTFQCPLPRELERIERSLTEELRKKEH